MKTTKPRWAPAAITAVLLLLGVTCLQGCGGSNANATRDLLGTVRSKKVLTIGTANDLPWSAVSSSGEATGIIPDLLREFFKREHMSGVEIKSTAMPFDSLIPSVNAGRIEMVGDSMFDTPEREKQVQFSRILFYNTETIVVVKGNPRNISKLSDLCGRVGATYKGTSWMADLNAASAQCPDGKSITIKTYDSVDQVIQDIANGRVDGGLISTSLSAYAIHQNPGLRVEMSPGYRPMSRSQSSNALAVSRGDKTFMAAFNKEYTAMLKEGVVQKIFEKWGLSPAKVWLPTS